MTTANGMTKTPAVVTQPTTNNDKPHILASSETQWNEGDWPVKEQEMNGLWVAQVLPV
jgi:hypothetical protein